MTATYDEIVRAITAQPVKRGGLRWGDPITVPNEEGEASDVDRNG